MIPRGPRPLVVAHRGGRYDDVPGEQTLAHAARAIALGADFVEVDVRVTADGEVVCVHDPEIAGVSVGAVSYADLAAACGAAGVPAPPTLGAMVEACRGRTRLDVELKEAGTEARVLAVVRGAGAMEWVVFKSFQDAVVAALKRLEPSCVAGLLLGVRRPRRGLWTRLGELFPEWRLRACRADFVCPHHRLLKAGFARRLRAQGYPVLVWTVNEAAQLRALGAAVDGLITDEVAACLALRG